LQVSQLKPTFDSPLVNMIGWAAPRIIGCWQRGQSTGA
jgi:hypothetical protein